MGGGSHCSIPFPLFFFLLLLLVAGEQQQQQQQQQPLPAAEQDAVYQVLDSINPAVDWRSLYPDDLCLYGPHGLLCDYFSSTDAATGDVPHVVQLNFGYVSDFSPNPPCSPHPAFTPLLSSASFPFLRKLFFYGCFNGSSRTPLPPHFWHLPSSLEELVFVDNPSLVGRLSARVGTFTRLRRLVITGTRLSGPIPDDVGNLPALQQLVLSRNRLRGNLPRSLARCRGLKILDLSGNRISGSLPPGMGQLAALLKLDLSGNHIAGPVPDAFSGLRRLEFLDLSRNNLTGGVPAAAMAAMANLKEAYLSGNPLGGRIPEEMWGNLGGLVGLGMSGLGLVGGIPASMGASLGKLCYLALDNNRLEGGVPGQFRRLEGTAMEINMENNLLRGGVPFSARFVAGIGGKLKLGGNPGLCLGRDLVAADPAEGGGTPLGYLSPCNQSGILLHHQLSVVPSSSWRTPFPIIIPLLVCILLLFLALCW